jgi:hypothetical protein
VFLAGSLEENRVRPSRGVGQPAWLHRLTCEWTGNRQYAYHMIDQNKKEKAKTTGVVEVIDHNSRGCRGSRVLEDSGSTRLVVRERRSGSHRHTERHRRVLSGALDFFFLCFLFPSFFQSLFCAKEQEGGAWGQRGEKRERSEKGGGGGSGDRPPSGHHSA